MTVRYFALRTSEVGKEKSVFTGRQPRQAALKAASRGFTTIFLRERGTHKLHYYKGLRKRVRAPVDRPDWMAAVVWKPNVKKMRVVHLKKPKAKKAKKRKAKRRVKRKAPKRKAKRKAKRRVKRKAPKRKAKRKAPKRKAKKRTVKRKAPKRKAKKRTVKRKAPKRKTTKRRKRR